jgi:hypothetical protein
LMQKERGECMEIWLMRVKLQIAKDAVKSRLRSSLSCADSARKGTALAKNRLISKWSAEDGFSCISHSIVGQRARARGFCVLPDRVRAR